VSLTPERWQQVARIYELVLDRDPASRDAFLSEACADDEALHREVQSLLVQDTQRLVLDRSVWSAAAPLLNAGADLLPGTSLGPYRIEGPLGAGGMGEVYRATDTRLGRVVAIKVLACGAALDQQMRVRFAREAMAVAALSHPHICTLYDVGCHEDTDFLVMEHLEGDTLAARLARSGMPVDEALACAIEIAGALDHAHRHGVVHRDLKPADIMLTASGAKLLDFGLAKFRGAAYPLAPEAGVSGGVLSESAARASRWIAGVDTHVTCHGAILGTIRYMAPEQVEGRDVDARSDLFSFGAVLFEMLTGRRAFDGDSVASVCASILKQEPPAVSSLQPLAPLAVDDIVHRCLAKNPDERWQTSSDVVRELKQIPGDGVLVPRGAPYAGKFRTPQLAWRFVAASLATGLIALAGVQLWRPSTTAAYHPIRSVAVLPLEPLSAGSEQEYFADGMTDQLIANLASVRGLRVISRTSVMHYKTLHKPVSAIARELQVDAIIEGTVVQAGSRVRITARLIRGPTGEIIWAQSFDRPLRDVLALQSDVAHAVTSKVHVTLTPQEQARLAGARPVDPEVHRYVLLGRHHTNKGTEDALRRAVQYFDIAIARDPANAVAHAGLAEAYTELSGFYVDPREAMPKAKRAAQRALHLDEATAEAHAALGFVHLVYDWDGPAAEKALLRALDLNPTLATARLNYAAYLTTQARHDDAVREIRRAIQLDPLSVRAHALGTSLLLFTRRYDDAITLAREGLEFEPNSAFTLAFLGIAYAEKRQFDNATELLHKAAQLDDSLTILALQAHVLAVAGRKQDAEKLIRRVQKAAEHRYFCPYEIATVYVSLGDADKAYRLFRKGTDERADCMAWLGVEPWIDPFRSDPRYGQLLRDVGLAPSAH
jgi:eukaryotic-like serine/threonine-protein kinase